MKLRSKGRKAGNSLIYVITDGKHVKIGRSHDIKARKASLQTGCPVPLVCLATFHPRRSAGYIEEMIHLILAGWRVSGEWFLPRDLAGVPRFVGRLIGELEQALIENGEDMPKKRRRAEIARKVGERLGVLK